MTILERKNRNMQRTLWPVCWVLLIILFASCERIDHKKNLDAYYRISAINDSVDKMTKTWHQMVLKAAGDKNFTGLAPYRLNIGKFLARNREAVSNITTTEGGEMIVDSEITFLSVRAAAVSDLYPRFELFNDLTPDDVLREQLKYLPADLENEMTANAAMKKTLWAFATKNASKERK